MNADAGLNIEAVPSPNHGDRRGITRPDMVVLHYTGMPDADEALRRLCSPDSEVSTHYLVFEDGRIVQCVAEAKRAWHAGVSVWAGITDINSHSIGIEIANPGHEHGYLDFPTAQIAAVIALCADVVARHGIAPERVLAHSDVAPARKQDPGEKFPWDELHAAGIGHWVEPAPITSAGSPLCPGASGPEVKSLQQMLIRYGYELAVSGHYDSVTAAVVMAFQRHFRPALIDGIADLSTILTLEALNSSSPRSRL